MAWDRRVAFFLSPACATHYFPVAALARAACPCTLNPQWSIAWEDLGQLTYIGRGGFGNVYRAVWGGTEVRLVHVGTIFIATGAFA